MTKYLFLILFSVPSFAQTPYETVKTWIDRQLKDLDVKGKDIPGTLAEDGRPCALALTDKDYGGSGYYIVVYPLEEPRVDEDYVGVAISNSGESAVIQRSDSHQMIMHSNSDWGNKSRFNTVTLSIDEDAKVLKATGVSDLRKYTCVFKFLGS